MAPNSLYPCSAVIGYRSAYAPHKMTLPLLAWSPISGGHPAGTNLNWNAAQTDTADLIEDFIDLLKPFFYTTTVFTDWTIYTYATPTAPARPVVSAQISGGAGTGGATIPASQASWMFKTTGFGVFKLVMLDTKVSAAFGPLTALVSPADDDEIAVIDYVKDDAMSFAGRDGDKVSVWHKITYTLNEKLRKSYRLD